MVTPVLQRPGLRDSLPRACAHIRWVILINMRFSKQLYSSNKFLWLEYFLEILSSHFYLYLDMKGDTNKETGQLVSFV